METKKAILGRRSVRDYEKKEVPEDILNEILKAGAMAPSAMDRQPCRYIIITDKEKIRELSDKVKDLAGALGLGARLLERMKLKDDVIFYDAPLLIMIVAEKSEGAPIDCALAAQNMMLRAYDLGLGSCFIGFAKLLHEDRETLEGLGVKGNQELYCPLIFGYPKGQSHEKKREAKIQKRLT
jgi:nitroreductase